MEEQGDILEELKLMADIWDDADDQEMSVFFVRCIGEIRGLREAVNALLHQIDIGDFVDSHGHSAKMLKATHDLMALMTPNAQ
ncbi:MAG TPA: hypothetical protein PKC22_09490 [Rhodocyclaceae bacterium]|nr:hypothetical protein [Rhodocyclaceae bacterium]